MNVHKVKGGDGVSLNVREWGKPDGVPVLLIHGWSQSYQCWIKQYDSDLVDRFRIVALDLRGHGNSEAPLDPAQYTDGDLWADDIDAVIRQLELKRPSLVGWSYGGFVLCDYLRKYGESNVGAINFVAAAVVLGPSAFGSLIGPGFFENAPAACEADLATNIAAMRKLLRACIVKPIPMDDFETFLAFNMVVSPAVRGSLIQRQLDFGKTLESKTSHACYPRNGRFGDPTRDERVHPQKL